MSNLEKLLEVGEYLYSIDQVKEENFIGFNKIDYKLWDSVSKSMDEAKISLLLRKYRNQITNKFGDNTYQIITNNIPESRLVIKDGIISVYGKLSKSDFSSYLNLVKSRKCKYNSTVPGWEYPIDFDFAEFLQAANKEGLSVEVKEEGQIKEKAIEREKARNTVFVTVENDYIKFKLSAYCSIFNDIFSNKNNIISGITEYVPSDHSRIMKSVRTAEEAIEKIKELMPEFEINISSSFKKLQEMEEQIDEASKTQIEKVALKLNREYKLFGHQNKAVKFLDKTNCNAILGCCMGSGKSLMSLAWAAKENKRVAVICPKVVRRTWIQEAQKFFPEYFKNSLELNGKKIPDNFADLTLVSCNYESLEKYYEKIVHGKFDVLIIDESHMIKEAKSKRTQRCLELSTYFKHRILLSGTAIKNSREDFLTQLNVIDKDIKYSRTDMTIGGFWHAISDCFLPMTKSDVLNFLPPKLMSTIGFPVKKPISMPKSIDELSSAKIESALSKIDITIDFINNIIDNSNDKCLVFSDSLEVVNAIYEHFKDIAILHHGQMSDDKREEAKKTFQDPFDNHRLFVTTRQSLAVGATMTAANIVIFNDLPWTSADINQAEDRTHRIGQKKTVSCYWMIAENSAFDERVCSILKRKYNLCKLYSEGKKLSQEEIDFMNKGFSFKDLA